MTTPSAFEGASSFSSQALRASQAAELTLQNIQTSADVVDALSSLRKLVKPSGTGDSLRLGNATNIPRPLPDIQILSAPFVLALIQEYRGKLSILSLAYTFRDFRLIERLCQQVYFPTQPVSMASLTLMNGVIMYMIKEFMWDGNSALSKDYDLQEFHDQAERNFNLGVETYEVTTQASLESVKVLMLAVSVCIKQLQSSLTVDQMMRAQEEGKPLLTWTFASTGARQAISLGYHRRSSLKNDPVDVAEDKRMVFWTFYMVDKNTSLNLGVPSTIQDYDIDVEYFQCSADPGVAPWDKAALAMVEMSRIQGLIFERLYSIQALSSSPETKARIIDNLAPQLQKWRVDWENVRCHTQL